MCRMAWCLLIPVSLAAQPPKLGERAPQFPGGSPGKQTLLLVERDTSKAHSTSVLKEAAERLAALQTALVVAAEAPHYGSACGAYLIDGGGVLRRAGQAGPEARDLVEFVELWRTGKVNFELACARCHGTDGNLDDYPRIKKLGGIGNRLTKEQMLERVFPVELSRDEISVRSHLFTRRELDALLVYISGL